MENVYAWDCASAHGIVVEWSAEKSMLRFGHEIEPDIWVPQSTADLVPEKKWKWMDDFARPKIAEAFENMGIYGATSQDFNDIYRLIIQLTRTYDEYSTVNWMFGNANPITWIPNESVLNRFQRVIEAKVGMRNIYNDGPDYYNARKKFIKKHNWNLYHHLVRCCQLYGFNLTEYAVKDFNTFCKKIVDHKKLASLRF